MPGKILIIDGIATNRISLRVRLCSAFYDVAQAASAEEGLRIVTNFQPDIVLVSSSLPDMPAVDLCRNVRNSPATADTALIVLACTPDPKARLDLLKAGADDVMERKADPRLLLARLRSLFRSGTSREDRKLHSQAVASVGFAEPASDFLRPAHVAILAGDTATGLTWAKQLKRERPYHFTLHPLHNLPREFGQGTEPDAIIIAPCAVDEDDFGGSVLTTLGAQPGFRRCPFLILLPDTPVEPAIRMLDLGAHDVMRGPFDPHEISLRLDHLLRRKARSDQMHARLQDGLHAALVDPLTGLHNRRYAEPELDRLLKQSKDTKRGLAVMLADLDHFKRINDRYGHAAGDAVLAEIARRLRGALGPEDLIARVGGEEFLLALPGLTQSEADKIAQHLCRIVSDTPVQISGPHRTVAVTISIGLAMSVSNTPSYNQRSSSQTPSASILALADQALYGAKTMGRNQVTTLSVPHL